MLRCGKHRGASFAQAAEDRGYSAWVLREVADGKRLHPNLYALSEYLKDAHGGVLCVGKYKNRFFDEVFKDDPAYVAWAATVTDPGPAMKSFCAYARGSGHACPQHGQPPSPSHHEHQYTREGIPKRIPVLKTIRKRPRRQKPILQSPPQNPNTRLSVIDMLCRRNSGLVAAPGAPQLAPRQDSEPKAPIEKVTQYIEQLQRAIKEGSVDLRGDPWIAPSNPFKEAVAINAQRRRDGERQINAIGALNLVLRPKVFAWVPEKIFPGRRLCCPYRHRRITGGRFQIATKHLVPR